MRCGIKVCLHDKNVRSVKSPKQHQIEAGGCGCGCRCFAGSQRSAGSCGGVKSRRARTRTRSLCLNSTQLSSHHTLAPSNDNGMLCVSSNDFLALMQQIQLESLAASRLLLSTTPLLSQLSNIIGSNSLHLLLAEWLLSQGKVTKVIHFADASLHFQIRNLRGDHQEIFLGLLAKPPMRWIAHDVSVCLAVGG